MGLGEAMTEWDWHSNWQGKQLLLLRDETVLRACSHVLECTSSEASNGMLPTNNGLALCVGGNKVDCWPDPDVQGWQVLAEGDLVQHSSGDGVGKNNALRDPRLLGRAGNACAEAALLAVLLLRVNDLVLLQELGKPTVELGAELRVVLPFLDQRVAHMR